MANLIPGPSIVETPEEYDGPIKYVNWNGFKIAAYTDVDLDAELLNEIKRRINDNRSVMIVITGPAGEGKSFMTLRLAQILDPNFKILDTDDEYYFVEEYDAAHFLKRKEREGYICEKEPHEKGGFVVRCLLPGDHIDPSQIVFDRSHFLYLMGNESPLKKGQVIMQDEAQYSMSSRKWYEDMQQDLMGALESVRSRGFIIMIVALHLEMLDKVIRKFVLSYMFHVEDRGRAVVYRLFTPRFDNKMHTNRLGELMLKFPDFDECPNPNCLDCPDLIGKNKERKRCMLLRARYERRKRAYVGARSKEAEDKVRASKQGIITYNDDELVKIVYEHKDKLTFVERSGRPDPVSIRRLFREVLDGKTIGKNRSNDIRNLFEVDYPEIRAPDKQP